MKKKKLKNSTGSSAMTFKYSGEIGAEQDLASLKKSLDLASARLTYAIQQEHYWQNQGQIRGQEFDIANTRYRQKKCGFTDLELQEGSSVTVWKYAK
jgi:hypothetical protein